MSLKEEYLVPLTPEAKYDITEDAEEIVGGFNDVIKCNRDYHFGCFYEVPPNVELVGSADFPVPIEDGYHFFTDTELMDALIRQRDIVSADLSDYDAPRRALICALSMELNYRQKWAPRFRGLPSLPARPKATYEQHYLIDQQVLDIHWRACSMNKPRGLIKDYPNLFDGKLWSVSGAVRFAERNLPFDMKVVDARLTMSMVTEHSALQDKSTAHLWRVLKNGVIRGARVDQWGAPQLEALLRESMQGQPHLVQHVPGLVRVWQAYRMVGRKPAQIARLAALMTGEEPVDRSAINRKLESLEARTGWNLDA